MNTPRTFVCSCWEDWEHHLLPKCLINQDLRDGIVEKRLQLARRKIREPKSHIAKTLGISLKDLEMREQGADGASLTYLISFAKQYNISFKWLVGLTDDDSGYSDDDIGYDYKSNVEWK